MKLRPFLLGRKAMTNLDTILKNRDNTLPTKVHLVKAMDFLVIMCGCESWTIKKVECQRIDAFKMWCWRRLLRVPWTARRLNQSILKEINHKYSLEGLMLIAEAPILWPPDAKSWFIGQYPDPGEDWGQEEKRARVDKMVGWHHRLNAHEFEQIQETVKDWEAWRSSLRSQKVEHDWVSEQQDSYFYYGHTFS